MRALLILSCAAAATTAQAQEGLSRAETATFRAQVARCWNVGALVGQAHKAVVTLRFELDRQGMPLHDSFELVGAGKDTSVAVKTAYDVAKRAIIRCGGEGYKLPLEKYVIWRNIDLTFNPERMSLR